LASVTTLDEIFREEWGRVLATLIGVLGDFDIAGAVSSISRSHRQRSAGTGVKDQPELRKASGDAGMSSITRNTTFSPCPREESNLRTRFRKPLLYPLSYEGR
jgi:hypothetical protein